MKNFSKLAALFVTLSLMAALFLGCNSIDNNQSPNLGYNYVTMSINPQVDFVVNNEGVVESVIFGNEDAEILLADVDLTGLTFEQASLKFAELATEAGYIDVDSIVNEVRIEVAGEKDDIAQNIANKIKQKVNNYFQNNGIFGNARVETLEKYLEQAENLSIDTTNMSMGKLKAIISALEQNPELDAQMLNDMNVGEIIKLISDKANQGNVLSRLKDNLKTDIENLKNGEYAQLETIKDEIKLLKEQMESMADGNEKDALKEEIDTKLQQYNDLKEAFIKEAEEIKEDYKEQSQTVKEEFKAQKEQRKQENKQKIQEHKDKINKSIDEFKEEIRKRQNGDDFNPFIGNPALRAAYETALNELKVKYGSMFILQNEIAALTEQIETFEGLEEEKEALEQLLEQKAYLLDEQFDAYTEELNIIIDSLKKDRANGGGNGKGGN